MILKPEKLLLIVGLCSLTSLNLQADICKRKLSATSIQRKEMDDLEKKRKLVALLKTFDEEFNLYNLTLIDSDPSGKKIKKRNLDEYEVDEKKLLKFSKDFFGFVSDYPSMLREMSIREFTNIYKMTALYLSVDEDMMDSVNCFLNMERGEQFFAYIIWAANKNENYLKKFHENKDQYKLHLFYEIMRWENDILFLSQSANRSINDTDLSDERKLELTKKYDDLSAQAHLRITMFMNLYLEIGLGSKTDLLNMLSEENLRRNQESGIDFDFYGRYGHAGYVINDYLKFMENLNQTDWSKTKEIFEDALFHAQRSIISNEYSMFINKLRTPLRMKGNPSPYQLLLRRDNFGMDM